MNSKVTIKPLAMVLEVVPRNFNPAWNCLLLDMTQEQLGALLGVEQSTVAAYEKASDMKYATLARIAAGLRCTPADLLPESQEQAQ